MNKKEEAEKARLLKEKSVPEKAGYFIVLMISLTLIYIVDELASNMNGAMQTYAILDLFHVPNADVNTKEYSTAVGIMGTVQVPAMALMLITPFYKALADRYGRKLFLILNTLIMGLGLFICMLSPHWIIYIVGLYTVQFVQSNDMQVMYIMETAPSNHRAMLCNLTKAIALMSVSLIGVFRAIFYNPADTSSWRMVLLIPAVLGIAVALLSIFSVHETPVFVERRLAYLNQTPEERAAKAAESKEAEAKEKGGVKAALSYIFQHRQTRLIALSGFIFTLSTGITGYYTTVLESGRSSGTLTANDITLFLIIMPFINAAFTFLCGILSDALGRTKGCLLFSLMACAGLLLFALGAKFGLSIWPIAIGYGMFIGTLWSVSDTLILVMPAESTPTEIRAAVVGTMALLIGIGMGISTVLYIVAINIVGAANIGLFGIALGIPVILISCLIITRIQETKGADLNAL